MVIRAFVASQANHVGFMIGGVKTQYPAENKHGRLALLFFIVHINTVLSLFTHCCQKFSFVVITRFLGGTFGRNLISGGHKNILVDRAAGSQNVARM